MNIVMIACHCRHFECMYAKQYIAVIALYVGVLYARHINLDILDVDSWSWNVNVVSLIDTKENCLLNSNTGYTEFKRKVFFFKF